MIGPDEPRYAAIGREMASSGDWITPRLWGEPWFEKPALLYWTTAAAFRIGLGEDLAPRVPITLLSLGFLVFFYFRIRRAFGIEVALYSTAILATSIGWIAYSEVGVTDLLLSVFFGSAMLLALDRASWKQDLAVGALLGLGVLAKALVPLVLAAPLILRRKIADLLLIGMACVAVALPWYWACYARNGKPFVDELFWRHHFQRFTTGETLHAQPFWFYVPVLLIGLLPWSAALAGLFSMQNVRVPERRFLLAWFLFGLLVFSFSKGKLAGYVLPLFPAAAVLMAIALAEHKYARWLVAICGFSVLIIPVVGAVLPSALVQGLRRSTIPIGPLLVLPVGGLLAIWCTALDRAGRRLMAAGVVAVFTLTAILYLKIAVVPRLDFVASVRPLWKRMEPDRASACVGEVQRSWVYGLNYYSISPLPPCSAGEFRIRIIPGAGGRPFIVR
jgi:4-amino-4-deoxy-L-arabinose transferase-like glycosyltransferase